MTLSFSHACPIDQLHELHLFSLLLTYRSPICVISLFPPLCACLSPSIFCLVLALQAILSHLTFCPIFYIPFPSSARLSRAKIYHHQVRRIHYPNPSIFLPLPSLGCRHYGYNLVFKSYIFYIPLGIRTHTSCSIYDTVSLFLTLLSIPPFDTPVASLDITSPYSRLLTGHYTTTHCVLAS
jgi:hypothetical protein